MAIRTIRELYDDLDNTVETEARPIKTRRFTIDGTQYEIDLHDDNHAGLRAAVAKYVEAARVISRPKTGPAPHGVTGSKKQRARIDKAQLDHMRDWLRSHGDNVSSYGRIPDRLREKYHEAHPTGTNPGTNGHAAESSNLEGVPQFSAVSS
jgi:hypothetical protein